MSKEYARTLMPVKAKRARRKKSKTWARWTARQCSKLFAAKPMPELQSPAWELAFSSANLRRPAFLGPHNAPSPFTVIPKL